MSYLNKKSSQQIGLQSDTVTKQYVARLDKISSDLKSLVEKLTNLQVPFTYVYALFSNEFSRTSKCVKHEEGCLTWGKDTKGKFQLRYNLYHVSIELGVGGFRKNGKPEILQHVDSKPVFELKAYQRMQLEDELVSFESELIKILKNETYRIYSTQEFISSPNRFDSYHVLHIADHVLPTHK